MWLFLSWCWRFYVKHVTRALWSECAMIELFLRYWLSPDRDWLYHCFISQPGVHTVTQTTWTHCGSPGKPDISSLLLLLLLDLLPLHVHAMPCLSCLFDIVSYISIYISMYTVCVAPVISFSVRYVRYSLACRCSALSLWPLRVISASWASCEVSPCCQHANLASLCNPLHAWSISSLCLSLLLEDCRRSHPSVLYLLV